MLIQQKMDYKYFYVCDNITSWSGVKNSGLTSDSWWRYWKYSNKMQKAGFHKKFWEGTEQNLSQLFDLLQVKACECLKKELFKCY